MAEPTVADVMKEIGRLESKVDALHKRQDALVEDVKVLTGVANMGKGALWMVLKIGGVIAFVAGVVLSLGWLKGQ